MDRTSIGCKSKTRESIHTRAGTGVASSVCKVYAGCRVLVYMMLLYIWHTHTSQLNSPHMNTQTRPSTLLSPHMNTHPRQLHADA